jgi:hypothetical protein
MNQHSEDATELLATVGFAVLSQTEENGELWILMDIDRDNWRSGHLPTLWPEGRKDMDVASPRSVTCLLGDDQYALCGASAGGSARILIVGPRASARRHRRSRAV